MARHRFALLLPILSVLITSGLWLWARQQYFAVIHSGSEGGWSVMWTDYTPVPLEVAGALNVPVATFAYPLYRLLQDRNIWELLVLLFGVAIFWAYIGFVVDSRKTPRKSTRLRRIAGAIGFLFGVFVLVVTIPMHHVAGIYKGAAVIWSLVICAHFANVFRNRAFPESVL
jgi:hypothetical protein